MNLFMKKFQNPVFISILHYTFYKPENWSNQGINLIII